MKTPYLDNRLFRLKSLPIDRSKEIKEIEAIKEALEPKVSKEEYYHLIGRCDSGLISEDELAEKLGIKFKEPEIELVEGEWYFVLKDLTWFYTKYREGCNWSEFEIREKNNPPTE
jgi:hypothetical protein